MGEEVEVGEVVVVGEKEDEDEDEEKKKKKKQLSVQALVSTGVRNKEAACALLFEKKPDLALSS